METEKNEEWKLVVQKTKRDEEKFLKPPGLNENLFLRNEEDIRIRSNSEKIKSPCWYYNTGGCRNKDGTSKNEEDCKYLHVYSPHIQRPQHISPNKPCDKYNLEGYCKWGEYCKYLHKNLSQDEWETYYPGIPYALKLNSQKRQMLEIKIGELESRINILEYKLKSMDDYYEKSLKLLKETMK